MSKLALATDEDFFKGNEDFESSLDLVKIEEGVYKVVFKGDDIDEANDCKLIK